MVWNPVWGCLSKCKYCYPNRMAKRFGMQIAKKEFEGKLFKEISANFSADAVQISHIVPTGKKFYIIAVPTPTKAGFPEASNVGISPSVPIFIPVQGIAAIVVIFGCVA